MKRWMFAIEDMSAHHTHRQHFPQHSQHEEEDETKYVYDIYSDVQPLEKGDRVARRVQSPPFLAICVKHIPAGSTRCPPAFAITPDTGPDS